MYLLQIWNFPCSVESFAWTFSSQSSFDGLFDVAQPKLKSVARQKTKIEEGQKAFIQLI